MYSTSYHNFLHIIIFYSKYVVHRFVWSFGTQNSLYNTLIWIDCLYLNSKILNTILCHVEMLNLDYNRMDVILMCFVITFFFHVNNISTLKFDLLNPSPS